MRREARAVRNDVFLRDVNQQTRSLEVERLSGATVAFVCECSRVGCRDPVYLSVSEFEGPGAVPGS
jgi:hypothetical protein